MFLFPSPLHVFPPCLRVCPSTAAVRQNVCFGDRKILPMFLFPWFLFPSCDCSAEWCVAGVRSGNSGRTPLIYATLLLQDPLR